jgi:hypothetical protein
MAITAGPLRVSYFTPRTKLEPVGRTEMATKTGLFAVTAAAAIVTFAAGWAVPQSKARIDGATGQVDTFKMMTTGKQLPSEHFADYSFVFN